jgi:hypothetical protein
MKNTLLTSTDFVKSNTNISDNISDKYLLPTIKEAQNEDLRGVVGDALLNKLKQLVYDGSIADTNNEKYKRLLDESQYFLAYSAISKLVLLTSYKLSNFGISTTSDEHINSPSFNEILSMKDLYTQKADFYKLQLQQFLLRNRTDYPELSANDCNSIKSNIYSVASSGLWLGGLRSKIERGKINTEKYCCDYDKYSKQ